MALLHIPLNQIDEARLLALIASGAAESRTIEYKRTTYGQSNSDYAEFLADISSFANTSGGDLVLGMDATNGIPTTITPLVDPIDPEKLRLEQCARGGLQPRIPNIDLHVVPIAAGGNVLIVRVPRSFNSPHRVVRQGSARFYARSSAGKYEPDVNELRTLFNAGPQLADRIRNFRLDRIAKIAAGHAPVKLMDRGTVVLHVVPLSAFDQSPALPLQNIKTEFTSFVPIASTTANNSLINFDGVLKTSNADQQATEHRAYVQLFRNGIVESVTSTIMAVSSGTPIISGLDDSIVFNVGRIMNNLAAVGVESPHVLLVSLIGVANAQFNFERSAFGAMWYDSLGARLDRDQYHFDEVIFETIPTTIEECARVVRPILDQMANAGGQATSPVFDAQGRYVPRER
jgi:hypothetical protein